MRPIPPDQNRMPSCRKVPNAVCYLLYRNLAKHRMHIFKNNPTYSIPFFPALYHFIQHFDGFCFFFHFQNIRFHIRIFPQQKPDSRCLPRRRCSFYINRREFFHSPLKYRRLIYVKLFFRKRYIWATLLHFPYPL